MGLRLGSQPATKATATFKVNVGIGTECPLGRTIWGDFHIVQVIGGTAIKTKKCLQTFPNVSWCVGGWGRIMPQLRTTALTLGLPGADLQIMSIFPVGLQPESTHHARPAQGCSGLLRSWVHLALAKGPITGGHHGAVRHRLIRQKPITNCHLSRRHTSASMVRLGSEGHPGRKKEQALPHRRRHNMKSLLSNQWGKTVEW